MYTDQMLQYDKERRKQRVKQREKTAKINFCGKRIESYLYALKYLLTLTNGTTELTLSPLGPILPRGPGGPGKPWNIS